MSAVARAPNPDKCWRSQYQRITLVLLAVIADLIRDLRHRKRTIHLVSLCVIARNEAIQKNQPVQEGKGWL